MVREKKKSEKTGESVVDYRHKNVKRLNIPPAGLTARGEIVREKYCMGLDAEEGNANEEN